MDKLKFSTFSPAPILQHFCSQCGSPLIRMVPPDDNQERDVCLNCGIILYRNPLVVVGTIPILNDKVLLCERAIEPRLGKWTFPAGFLELKESTAAGAKRETLEESGAIIEIGSLFTVIDVPNISQLHVYYLAKPLSEHLEPGPESVQARYFSFDEIPWDELAFLTIRTSLEHYLTDLKSGEFKTHFYQLGNESTDLAK